MSATIIDGKAIAQSILANVREEVLALNNSLHLAAVCAGSDESLRSFVKLKQKAAQSAGLDFSSYFFDEHDEEGILRTINYLARDEAVQGIFIELPLPTRLDADKILSHIPLAKDVDVISPEGERLFYGDENPIWPPAVKALEHALDGCDLDLAGASTAVVGQGRLVGRPIAHWLRRQGARVTSVDAATNSPESITSQADLVVVGAGSPGLISDKWIGEGAIVIDYGYNRDKDGAVVGDVDLKSVSKKASFITPVPGGMGPLVIAAVMENLLNLAMK